VKVCEFPFRVASNTAVVFMLTAEAFTVNPAAVAPAATATDDGAERFPDPLLSAIVAPPAGAGAGSVILQAAEPGVGIAAGEQVNPSAPELEVMVTWPLVAVTGAEVLLTVAPLLLITWMTETLLVAVGDTVNVAMATTPLVSVVLFKPNSTQV